MGEEYRGRVFLVHYTTFFICENEVIFEEKVGKMTNFFSLFGFQCVAKNIEG
jgi:hypothetical protein